MRRSHPSAFRRGLAVAVCLSLSLGVAACKKKGPAEQAGESMDKLGNKIQDTVDPPKGPVEKAGRAVDRATGNN